jgi:bisphosphoglycerate-dependent phosphoglycerate mutase
MSEQLQHLVLVRHGKSVGDARREAWQRGEPFIATKLPEHEELIPDGYIENEAGGNWINRNILLGQYALRHFDYYICSSVLRAEQAAIALDLPDALWQEDPRLDERNRGDIRGLRKQEHKAQYPDSYDQMITDPLHWLPPHGETIMDLVEKQTDFYQDLEMMARTAIIVGHRDTMWASMAPLEGLSETELAKVNTNNIHNGQIWHYTSIDPKTGWQAPQLMWKFVVDPLHPETASGWQVLPNIVQQYVQVA